MITAIRDTFGRYAGTAARPRASVPCVCGDHVFCRTSSWGVALVSPADRAIIDAGALHLRVDGRNAYAIRKIENKNKPLHQLVMPLAHPLEPDHENRNGLDNRRSNLRPLTRGDNNRNCRASAKHGYVGVTFHKSSGLWRGYVNAGGRQRSAGYFKLAADAAAARDRLIIELGISTASLNTERLK